MYNYGNGMLKRKTLNERNDTTMSDEKKYPQNCPYNGQTEEECQCDECDSFLECYPEYDFMEVKYNEFT